jgi:hypothetical protein
MLEIAAIIGLSAVVLYAVVVGTAWFIHGRTAGPRERALFTRWAVWGGLLATAITVWTVAGIAAFLSPAEFWRGAWAGGSAVLWLGYLPALILAVRAGSRQTAAAGLGR